MIMPNWCWNTLHVGQTMTNPSKLPLKSSLQGKGIRESIYADYEGWHVCFFLLGRQHMKKKGELCFGPVGYSTETAAKSVIETCGEHDSSRLLHLYRDGNGRD